MNEELKNLNKKVIEELSNTEYKKIVIEAQEILTPEQRLAIEEIRKIKNQFAMISVEDVMKDLKICRTIAYRVFQREDFPSINIGKSNQVMLLPYLIWKMTKKV